MTTTLGTDKRVVVDADALIGLIHKKDALHERCVEVVDFFVENEYTSIIPYPTVLEAATTLSRAISKPTFAKQLLEDFAHVADQNYEKEQIGGEVARSFNPDASKQNTPFDHYVLAVAKLNSIPTVFSFDSFYEKNGLTLAETLLR